MDSQKPTLIRLPYSLKQVLQRTDQLKYDIFAPYVDKTPGVEEWSTICREVNRVLKTAKYDAVSNSLLPYAGIYLTNRLIDEISAILAGNEYRLAKGRSVTRWSGQRQPEWVPAHVQSFEPTETRDRRPAGRFTFRIMAGTSSACLIQKVWSTRFVPILARRLGYTSRRGGMIFSDISELVNLCLVLLIEPRLCRVDKPGFEHVACTRLILKRNRKIIQHRFRREGYKDWPCPRGFQHRCYKCPVGFDQCDAATHRITVRIG